MAEEDQLRQLESDIADLKIEMAKERVARRVNAGWATLLAALIVAWAGYTTFYDIPRQVEASQTGKIAQEIGKLKKQAQNDSNAIAETLKNLDVQLGEADSDSGYAIFGDLQFCWGKEKLTKATPSAHREFRCVFAESFACKPVVSAGLYTYKEGEIAKVYGVYGHEVRESGFYGQAYAALGGDAPGDPVIHYVAIGKSKPRANGN